jgi:hypothetical protein
MTRNPWLRIGTDAWLLGMEASTVMGLRMMKLAAGGTAAESEARRMVGEKIDAGLDLHAKAVTGALGFTPHGAASKSISHYRRAVRANRRRLLKG